MCLVWPVLTVYRVSTQLYTDITHFILELIQNADDNVYDSRVRPTLRLQLSRSELLVECNEVGFSEENVRAICDLNASTKKWRKKVDDGCIGEKGIGEKNKFPELTFSGFKSVFAVATTVSIYSNGFNFALDRRRQLGLLNPIIVEEPHPKASPGWTLFVLGLEIDNDGFYAVKTRLQEIQPEMLLFTRRLREIEITFGEVQRSNDTSAHSNNRVNTSEMITYNVKMEEGCSQIYAITSATMQSQTAVRYFRQELEVPDMPNHPHRLDVTETKIILAFPFTTDHVPIIGEQNIFAFMPLRKTSFPVFTVYPNH